MLYAIDMINGDAIGKCIDKEKDYVDICDVFLTFIPLKLTER